MKLDAIMSSECANSDIRSFDYIMKLAGQETSGDELTDEKTKEAFNLVYKLTFVMLLLWTYPYTTARCTYS